MIDDRQVKQGAGKVFLQLKEMELDKLRLQADQVRKQNAAQQQSKEAQAWYALRRQEAELDERIRRTRTWSSKWWYLLEQLDIVRKKVIVMHRELTAPKDNPQPMGQIGSIPTLPIRTDLALSRTLDRIER